MVCIALAMTAIVTFVAIFSTFFIVPLEIAQEMYQLTSVYSVKYC